MRLIIFGLLIIVLQSCVKDKPLNIKVANLNVLSNNLVYIVNEGPFNTGAGSISLYDPESNAVAPDYYYQQNGSKLGNIVQSMTLVNNDYCIVVNNSGKLVFCDKNFNKTHQITGFNSPRYIQQINFKKAYVTDLYANTISIVDLINYSITSSIYCHGKTEKIIYCDNKIFVTNTDKAYLYIINPTLDIISDSLYVGFNAYGIELDQNNKVWVLSSGKSGISGGKLTKINPSSLQIEKYFSFPNNEFPNYLCFNKTRDTMYFANKNIYKMCINDNSLPNLFFINSSNFNIYGLGINPNDYKVYFSNAIDFMQSSSIYVYDGNGTYLNTFKTDIGANSFYFK